MSSKEQTEQHVGQKRSAQAAETQNYDIAIIGGGVVGGMIAYHLAKYRSHVVILEKEHDAAMGQSKANSGIVHAGYDPRPGSLKAILNVAGSEMMEEVCRNLAVKYRRNGTLVVGFGEEDQKNLEILLERGKQNGVRALSLISARRRKEFERARHLRARRADRRGGLSLRADLARDWSRDGLWNGFFDGF